MSDRTRPLAIAVVAGLLVAAVSVFGGVWLAGALDDEPSVDGEVVLDQPGIYQQPSDDVNVDSTGRTVPDVALTALDGRSVTLADYRGGPMVVNVWYSFCPPCERELRDFAEVHVERGGALQFVGVDPFDSPEVMERFARERGVTYDLLRDPGREFSIALDIVAYPVTLFVDGDGEILRQTGELDAAELRAAIDELF